MVRPVGRGLDPSAGGCPGDGRWREVSRGVGDAAPYGLPGMGGGGRLPLIRPCGATFPQGGRQGLLLAAAQAFAGRRGRRPPTVCPGKGGSGSLPLIRPCRATFPRGGRQGLQGRDSSLPGKGGDGRSRRGGGTPPYGWGYGNAVGFTWAPVSGPPRGRGRACPARGVTRTPVNGSVRRGGVLTPPRVAARGMAVSGRFRGASGTPPPTGCPGKGGSGSLPLIRPCGATFPRGGRQGLYGGSGSFPLPRQLVLGAELEGQAVVPAV